MTKGVRIAGLGHHVPARHVPNAEIEEGLGLEAGWIESRTGIRSRFWALPEDTLSNLAEKSGDMALQAAGMDRDAVGLLLLATSTPDQPLPPSAPLVTHRLGLARAGAVDLAGACSGFIYAVSFADAYVRLHGKPALVIAANILSRRINPSERASAVVFADAAGAVLLAPSDDASHGVLGAALGSDGSGYGLIQIPTGGTQMTISDGRELFVRAVDMMSRSAEQALAAAGLEPRDIDRFVPHQANARISAAAARRLGIADDRIVSTIADYGNSSAATIPLSLSLAHVAMPLQPGETLLLAAAGAGLTAGALVIGT